jgi:hypothetical protein
MFSVIILSLFFIYFKTANASFSNSTIDLQNVENELNVWGNWQWVRTFFGTLAFSTFLFSYTNCQK